MWFELISNVVVTTAPTLWTYCYIDLSSIRGLSEEYPRTIRGAIFHGMEVQNTDACVDNTQ